MFRHVYFLEMTDPRALRPRACPPGPYRVEETIPKQWQFNRYLYEIVGSPWHWTDNHIWSPEQWRAFALAEGLRTWVLYHAGTPVGYYELRKAKDEIEIVHFGLVTEFLGRGLGGFLLTHALRSAWAWRARRIWVHTCNLDHPGALHNYLARGMCLYHTAIFPPTAPE